MTENQKLREALLTGRDYILEALVKHDQEYQRHPATEDDRQQIIEDFREIERALALPTAEPVGERYSVKHEITQGGYRLFTVTDSESQCSEDVFPDDSPVLYGLLTALGARAALIAGDAVDAQRTPLTDKQIDNLIHTNHFDPKFKLRDSDKVCLNWYRLGLRDGERAHGIDAAMRKDNP